MRYKEDWEMASKRLSAFWDQEILDRACVSVICHDPDDHITLPSELGSDEERLRFWTDPEVIIKNQRREMEHTYYAGDAFPRMYLNVGACAHAGFFKGEKHYFEDTVWFFPSLDDLDDLEFDPDSFLYHKTLELARAFAEDCNGDYIITMPDSVGNSDALAYLRGTEDLMADMLEDPEAVKRALDKISYAYDITMKQSYDIIRDANGGGAGIGWLYTYAPGFHAQIQCDLSVMISNPMFKEFIMPEIRHQCDLLEYPLYHLDGVEQTRHLDDLLSVEKLRAIQWTQVKGQKPATEYLEYLKKIQAAGKSLLILAEPDQVDFFMENLSSRGLYLVVWVDHKDEADAIVKQVAKLTHD